MTQGLTEDVDRLMSPPSHAHDGRAKVTKTQYVTPARDTRRQRSERSERSFLQTLQRLKSEGSWSLHVKCHRQEGRDLILLLLS